MAQEIQTESFVKDFKEVKEQEDPNVRYWFEDDKGNIISYVGPTKFDPNAGVRISYGGENFEVPVSASVWNYETKTPTDILRVADNAIRRRKEFPPEPEKESVPTKPRAPRAPPSEATKQKQTLSGYIRRLDNVEHGSSYPSKSLVRVIQEMKKALKAGDLMLAQDLASVVQVIKTDEKSKFSEKWDRKSSHQGKDARGVIGHIKAELEKMTGKITAGETLRDENERVSRQPSHSKNAVLKTVMTAFKQEDAKDAKREANYKAKNIAHWRRELKETKGKDDKVSRARHELAEAGLAQELGKITYKEYDRIRGKKSIQGPLEQHFEQEREKDRQKRRREGVKKLKAKRELLASDLEARFVNEFDTPWRGWSGDEFKEALDKFREQPPYMGTKMDTSHIAAIMVNDDFLKGATVSEPIAIKFNNKKFKEEAGGVIEGKETSILQLNGSAFGIDAVKNIFKTLGANEPLLFQTVRKTAGSTQELLLATNAKGERIVLAPRVPDSPDAVAKAPSITQVGEVVPTFTPSHPKPVMESKQEIPSGVQSLRGRYVGKVYRNNVTGDEFKVIRQNRDSRLLTLKGSGMKFDTTPELMGNYSYVGRKFTRNKSEQIRRSLGLPKRTLRHHAPKKQKRSKRPHHARSSIRRGSIRKTSRSVKPHAEIRDTCEKCGKTHTKDEDRFHGVGSFSRTHTGTSKRSHGRDKHRREEKMM